MQPGRDPAEIVQCAAVLGPGAEVVEQQTNFREMWADNPALYLDVHYTTF